MDLGCRNGHTALVQELENFLTTQQCCTLVQEQLAKEADAEADTMAEAFSSVLNNSGEDDTEE